MGMKREGERRDLYSSSMALIKNQKCVFPELFGERKSPVSGAHYGLCMKTRDVPSMFLPQTNSDLDFECLPVLFLPPIQYFGNTLKKEKVTPNGFFHFNGIFNHMTF